MLDLSDPQLVESALRGDMLAFRRLVERHQTFVYRVAYRLVGTVGDAEDIAQESFIRLWKHLNRYRDEIRLTTWLYKIVTNLCLDFLKSPYNKTRKRTTGVNGFHALTGSLPADQHLLNEGSKRLLPVLRYPEKRRNLWDTFLNRSPMAATGFKYELFFELSPDLLCIAGYDGYFKKINPAVAKTLGYPLEELYARPISDFVHPEDRDRTNKARAELTKSKPLFHFENRYLTKNGETVWLSWTSLPVDSDNLIFAIAKNVTHKKRLEADRNTLLANLSKANKDLLKLNYAASHDLQSPVNNLLALFELMDTSKIGDKETAQLVDVLQYAGEKIKHTLNNYTIHNTDSNALHVDVDTCDLQQCLDQVLESLSTLIDTSEATILTDFSKLNRITFNRNYLKSIFLNLITNAIKFAFPDRRAVIKIHASQDNNFDKLVIADNGPGLDIRKIKSDYFMIDPKAEHCHGKGIGLYLVHTYVSAFGGEIKVDSKIGEGTTFTLLFRRHR